MDSSETAPLIPAATVILIRDGEAGLETLMLQRNKSLKAFGGIWVFPGGRVDDADTSPKATACRETREETGLSISEDQLVSLSRWIPPVEEKRRFSTDFFIAPAPDAPVKIDDGEIHDYRWVCPKAVVKNAPDPDLILMPPTFVSLFEISQFNTVAETLMGIEQKDDEYFETKFKRGDKEFVTLWAPDAGFDTLDLALPGPRRRLVATQDGWDYQKQF